MMLFDFTMSWQSEFRVIVSLVNLFIFRSFPQNSELSLFSYLVTLLFFGFSRKILSFRLSLFSFWQFVYFMKIPGKFRLSEFSVIQFLGELVYFLNFPAKFRTLSFWVFLSTIRLWLVFADAESWNLPDFQAVHTRIGTSWSSPPKQPHWYPQGRSGTPDATPADP